MKRILVTGGAGFIGSHTVDLLLQKDYQVIVYDNLSTGKIANLDKQHVNLKIVQADTLDYPRLVNEIMQVDAVLHLAALASVPKSIENPIESLKVNSLGLVHVLQAIREAKKPIRLVYASSAAVYGDAKTLPCNDDQMITGNILSPYALEKTNNEQYANLFLQLFGIKSVGLRYFNVYGPRQDPTSPYSGVISKFIENYHAGKSLMIFGDGKQSRDFIHVHDVARANLLALTSDFTGVLNIATGVPETLLNLIYYIETVAGQPAKIDYLAGREGDIRESYARVDKAKQYLTFQSEIGLKDGIVGMVGC